MFCNSEATWRAIVVFQPIRCVHGRLFLTCCCASLKFRCKNFMVRMIPRVPARWAPAQQWIITFAKRKCSSILSKIGSSRVRVLHPFTAASISLLTTGNLKCSGAPGCPAQGGSGTLYVQLMSKPILWCCRRSRSCAAPTPPWKMHPSSVLSGFKMMMRCMLLWFAVWVCPRMSYA